MERSVMLITKIITVGVMSRPAGGTPAFTECRHSKSPDLCTLINPCGYY